MTNKKNLNVKEKCNSVNLQITYAKKLYFD